MDVFKIAHSAKRKVWRGPFWNCRKIARSHTIGVLEPYWTVSGCALWGAESSGWLAELCPNSDRRVAPSLLR